MRTRAASPSRDRSRWPGSVRSRPIRSRPSAASRSSTARSRRPRPAHRRALRRGAARPRLRRGRGRGAAGAHGAPDPRRHRAAVRDPGERDFRRVLGGMLAAGTRSRLRRARGNARRLAAPRRRAVGGPALRLAVCKHVSSNAIVIAKSGQTIGIGAGQMSRVDAVRIALENAERHGHDLTGASLATDAFFPFPDGPEAGARGGRDGADPAGRLSSRPRGDRSGRRGRRSVTGAHRPPALPPLSAPRAVPASRRTLV